MSADEERGFLSRWSQRKRDAGKAEPEQAAAEAPAQAGPEAPAAEPEPPFDLESLPKLDELTANTDMTVFFRKGVPESIRNAALRKSWALDPAIRNYVNPALDYAFDWNTPGGVPGAGELAPGTDIARMVAQIIGGNDSQSPVEGPPRANEVSNRVTNEMRQPDAPPQPVRLSDAASQKPAATEEPADFAVKRATAAESAADREAEPPDERRSFASQQDGRRHGGARPK